MSPPPASALHCSGRKDGGVLGRPPLPKLLGSAAFGALHSGSATLPRHKGTPLRGRGWELVFRLQGQGATLHLYAKAKLSHCHGHPQRQPGKGGCSLGPQREGTWDGHWERGCMVEYVRPSSNTAELPKSIQLTVEFYFYKIVLDLWPYVYVYL